MFNWLALNIGPLIAGLIIFFVVKYAFKWAQAGPWGAILLMVTAWLVVQGARILFVPTVDVAYVDVRDQVRDSEMGADAAKVLGALPDNLGFTGQGAQSQVFQTPKPEGHVPTGGQQTQIVVAAAEPAVVSIAEPTIFEFANPVAVTPKGETLILEYPDGRIVQVETAGIEATACGIDLRRHDAAGQPTHALACPVKDNVTFALSQVTLPADWPQLPARLMPQTVTNPEGSGGGGGNWLVGGDASGQCLQAELKRLGFVNSNQFGTDWLPSGTTWTLSYPGKWAWFTYAGNEHWPLVSADWSWMKFEINGVLARAMKPTADVNTIFGTGPVPKSCR